MPCQFYLLNVIFCWFCFLMPMPSAESQYDVIHFTTEQNEKKVLEFLMVTEVNCGETQTMVDVCFKNLPPHLMEFLQKTKIAVNKDEIASKCTVFKRGMECFDRYTERCLPKDKVFHFQNNVAGARKFLSKFCDDHKFQKEYLKHKECFYHIQEDWKRCTKEFQSILLNELRGHNTMNITNKYMQFCCARHAYETCIYNSARFKCFQNATKFSTETAKMLSEEKLFSNCRQYENLVCAAPRISVKEQTFSLVFLLICLFTAVI
ncbi:uncharacterized protein LOC129915836 [Episyrphus balteatus]|uniref:uncharacterized protein LOC129915836 n=1 Tax=Episyrphus balteatus TaxID=286459 RepID=UPI00248677EF|nr:uncharacterized protein LOC129915836 [Episyrphus balteatus]